MNTGMRNKLVRIFFHIMAVIYSINSFHCPHFQFMLKGIFREIKGI